MAKLIKVWDGTTWQSVGVAAAQGPTGPTGATGPQGATGPAGSNGATGPIGPSRLKFLSGYYYTYFDVSQNNNITFSANLTHFSPIYIPTTTTFDRIVVRSGSTWSGTGSIRLGIYNNSIDDRPDTVNLDAGIVSITAASADNEIVISKELTPGWYWLAANMTVSPTTSSVVASSTGTFTVSFLGGQVSPNGSLIKGFTQSVNASSGFANASSLGINTSPVRVWLRAQ